MFSQRLTKMNAPPIYEILELAKQYNDVIYFNLGEPDFDTPDIIKQAAIDAIKRGKTKYTGSFGLMELREDIANYESNYIGKELTAGNVIITSGGTTALTESVLAFANPGDEVIVMDPWWPGHLRSIAIADASPKPIKMRQKNGEYRIDLEKINESITEKTRGIMIINPNNPTGTVFSKHELKGLIEIAEDNKLFIISDEVYDRIVYNGNFTSLGSLVDDFERVFIVRSFSKNYAMTGWRLGYIVSSERNIKILGKLNSAISLSQVSIAQYAALSIFKNIEEIEKIVQDMVNEYKVRRDIVIKALKKTGIFEFNVPQGAFYIFPKYNLEMESTEFVKFILHRGRILFAPGYQYFSYAYKNNIRISYSVSTDKVKIGMERLVEVFEEAGT